MLANPRVSMYSTHPAPHRIPQPAHRRVIFPYFSYFQTVSVSHFHMGSYYESLNSATLENAVRVSLFDPSGYASPSLRHKAADPIHIK